MNDSEDRSRLSHLDREGRARMVDVGAKPVTHRRAVAAGRVQLDEEAFDRLATDRLAKGAAIEVARLAGIQAAKRTSEWIPLCHPVALDNVGVEIELLRDQRQAVVTACASAHARTGVEMEALTAVSAGCLALYDMVKSVDRAARILEIRVLEKDGGRSGPWSADSSAD